MKYSIKIFTFILVLAEGILASCSVEPSSGPESSEIESGFRNIPDSLQTSVYWYWISDNVSKEGVVNDLKAMKKAGINRAFIGNIGLNDVPWGNVKMLSDEWWEVLHTALKTATELNIEIGIFNCPGWSQSGGPWINPGEAMRYLSSSEVRVKGPGKFRKKLEKPVEIFQDVRVIAWPASKDDNLVLNNKNGKVTSVSEVTGLDKIFDGNKNTGISFPDDSLIILDFAAEISFTARSLSIRPAEQPMLADGILMAKDSTREFRTISEFRINRSNPALNVGFEPYAPVVVSFPSVSSTGFRLILKNMRNGGGIAEVELAARPRVERYIEKTLAKMHPTPLPYWHDYLWPDQPEPQDKSLIIDPLNVIDITKNMDSEGLLTWDIPDGEWIILRTGMTPTGTKNSPSSPEATGYEVDKLSKKHVEKHFYGHMGEVLKRIPEADRTSFKMVVQDSYEMGGQNFTDGFVEEFQARYGYDPLPYIPVYYGNVVGSELASDRFLWDMRRLVADKVAYDYVGGFREISNKFGLRTWLECYGHWGFPSEFLMYGGQSDEIGGEFWSEGELGDIENRAASSCGHIYGKNKISAESNTCAGKPFSRYPAVIKQRGDRFFAEGINNTLLHVFISQPYEDKNPGINAWFGNEFNRKNTWFSQIDTYIHYLKRVNFMLQQGLNVADAAYFIGEDAPKMTGVTDPALPVGYQFDYVNAEVIEKFMSVQDGLITLPHGTQYRILVLPRLETMRPGVLAKIKQLVNEGAVVMGPAPERSPSLQDQPGADIKVHEMAAELWGGVDGIGLKYKKVGKGIIMNGLTMPEAFARIDCVPDCKLPENNSIHYGHRKAGNMDIYFVSNQTDKSWVIHPEFRVTGKHPELWEPTTGNIRRLPAYEKKKKTTVVPLRLEPFESIFVVFRKKAVRSSKHGVRDNYPDPVLVTDIKGPWTVAFDPSMRGPGQPVVFDTLYDWTSSGDERIKYYSGTAFYTTTFNFDELPPRHKVVLDLGGLTAMAKVSVNNLYAGGVWTSPYRLDITDLVKPGDNELKIELVNTWMNRLIGDSKLPPEKRPTWCPVNPYKPGNSLQPSGLFGPVTVLAMEYHD